MSHIGEDPFATPPEERDPVRRFRGQMVAPVTLWTTIGEGGSMVGLTVSSVLVVEGEPPSVLGLVGPLTDFYDALCASGRFVVHLLARDQRRLGDLFAGRLPSPDPFSGLAVGPTPWGPVLEEVRTRVSCQLTGCSEVGYSVLVQATVERVELDPKTAPPLVYHHGGYATVASGGL